MDISGGEPDVLGLLASSAASIAGPEAEFHWHTGIEVAQHLCPFRTPNGRAVRIAGRGRLRYYSEEGRP